MKKLILALAVILFSQTNFGQSKGILKGKILSVSNGNPISYANVFISKDTNKHIQVNSNWDGTYLLNELDTGIWNVVFFANGYDSKEIKQIKIVANKAIVLNVTLSQSSGLNSTSEGLSNLYPALVRDKTNANSGTTRTQIQQMAVRSVADITKTAGNGIVSKDDGSASCCVRGQRSGSSVTFIDGIKVIGSASLPRSAIEEVSVKTGGVSAQYENDMSSEVSEVRILNSTTRISSKRVRKTTRYPEETYSEPVEQIVYYENELYQEVADNEFESPRQAPLSTFSIDVDKASYANTRRFLNEGMLPPVNAVRIEELINYFDYDYPQPEGEHPFSITTELAACPWNAERKLALIGI